MKFNSIKELEEQLFLCDVKTVDLKNELNNYLNDLRKLGLFNPMKKSIKERVKEIKKSLKELETEKKYCEDTFTNCTTFKENVFLPFLAKYMSLVEKEEYVTFPVHAAVLREVRLAYVDEEYFKMIATVDNKVRLNKISGNGYKGADTDNINEFLKACVDDKYLILYAKDTYSLLIGTKLDRYFCKYPYLKELAYQIVDLRLKNPMLTDRDILDSMLENPYVKKINK